MVHAIGVLGKGASLPKGYQAFHMLNPALHTHNFLLSTPAKGEGLEILLFRYIYVFSTPIVSTWSLYRNYTKQNLAIISGREHIFTHAQESHKEPVYSFH